MEIREGTAATIRNFIVMGFKEWAIDFSNSSTLTQWANGSLSLSDGIVFDNGKLSGFTSSQFDSDARSRVGAVPTIRVGQNPGLIDPYNLDVPNYRPASIAALAGGQMAAAIPPSDEFFEVALFIGALSPDPALDWTRQGWTNFDRR
jgi:hypothetical protein